MKLVVVMPDYECVLTQFAHFQLLPHDMGQTSINGKIFIKKVHSRLAKKHGSYYSI